MDAVDMRSEPPDTAAGRFPFAPACVGVLGTILVVFGAGLPGSPFTSKLPGSWFFGVGPSSNSQWLSLVLVYGGMVVLLSGWLSLVAVATHCSLRQLTAVLGMWIVPLLVSPPLFSRDVYDYAASGKLVSAGYNPYTNGLAPVRSSVFFHLTDPLWRNAHAPYGPLFFDIAKVNARLMGNDVSGTLEGFRLVALLGVALLAVAVPVVARSVGRSVPCAFTLAVLNPLVLIYFVGGMHNDALMVGLLMAGIALASRGRPIAGIVLCALAAEVKIPAVLGVVFIGWVWAGLDVPPLRRLRFVAQACALGGLFMALISQVSGFGWGWLVNLSTPGAVVSWLDPATAAGLAVAHGLHVVGTATSTHAVIVDVRAAALVLAACVVFLLLTHVDRLGLPRALGWSLLAVVLLGPIVWPWYETWGITFLALAVDAWSRRSVLVLSIVGCFATIPTDVRVSTHAVALVTLILIALAVGSAVVLSKHWRVAHVPSSSAR
jgi:alpha-1,6-mannosyltransferase